MKPDSHVLQPVYSGNGQLLFAEVLARFGGRDTQATILEAEANGSIVQIDLAGLDYGINAAVPVAVNLSPRTIELSMLEVAKRIRPGLIVEITETHPARLDKLKTLAFEVHARGGFISLDDVNSGEFSDRAWLKTVITAMRPSWLKLPIDADAELISWCLATRIPIVVERIETQWDLRMALEFGATGFQGWFFDAPTGAAWLHRQRASQLIRGFDELALAMAC